MSSLKAWKGGLVFLSYSRGDSVVFVQPKLIIMSWAISAALKRCSVPSVMKVRKTNIFVFLAFLQSFTMLGVALAKVELNETNFSEVLRLFIISRNAGDPHPVRSALVYFCYPCSQSYNGWLMLYFVSQIIAK